jgi:hypothetical protein
MFESVLNPGYWIATTAVSVPIIIHLLNRLRYKRIRWAAMEFLLKSQQRNRRKLIIEQLLLLLLRCLLVLMVVLLLLRPTWNLEDEGRSSDWPHHHVIVLDDSWSMKDLENPDISAEADAFRTAAKLVGDLADHQQQSGGTHYWTVLRMSDPSRPVFGPPLPEGAEEYKGQQLNQAKVDELRELLADREMQATYLPLSPLPSIQVARNMLLRVKEGHKHLHLVGDFRSTDWTGAAGDALLAPLSEMGYLEKVRLRLHDVAMPSRKENTAATPEGNPSIGILDVMARPLRSADPAAVAAAAANDLPLRAVTPRLPFSLQVKVRNFSAAEQRNWRVSVRLEGSERNARMIERLGPGEERTLAFTLEFGLDEPPGLKPIAVHLEGPKKADHLDADNARFTFVELRREVAVLIVDPEYRPNKELPPNRTPPDAFFLDAALRSTPRVRIKAEYTTPKDLATRKDLDRFTVIYLVNVAGQGSNDAELTAETIAALENYVHNGGSVAFFLGARTNVASFNQHLHRNGKGLFPAPLMLRPTPGSSQPFVDEAPDATDPHPKVRFVQPGHPVLPFEGENADLLSRYIVVNRYFRVDPQWKMPPTASVVLQLANRQPLLQFRNTALNLAAALEREATGAPPEMAAKLTDYASRITKAVDDPETKRSQKGDLIEALAGVLNDPVLRRHWEPKAKEALRGQLQRFLDVLQQGDPLVLEASLEGNPASGRVMVFLTSMAPLPVEGKEYGWNNLAVADLGEMFFAPMILSLQNYLASYSLAAGGPVNRLVGLPVELRYGKDRFLGQVEWWQQRDTANLPVLVGTFKAEKVTPLRPAPASPTSGEQFDYFVRLPTPTRPGLYRIKLLPSAGPIDPTKLEQMGEQIANQAPEERPLAFNVDNRQEGALQRISEGEFRELLSRALNQGKARVAMPEAARFAQETAWFQVNPLRDEAKEVVRNRSWSDYSWILLAFILVLTLEQYLAMKFSHHVK